MLTIYHNDFESAQGGAAPFIAAVAKGLKALGITPTFVPLGWKGRVDFPVDETKRSIGMVFYAQFTRMDSGNIGVKVMDTFPLWTRNPQAPFRHPIVVVTKSDNPSRLFRHTNFHKKMDGVLTSAYCLPKEISGMYTDEAPIEVFPEEVEQVCKAIKQWMDIPMEKLAPPVMLPAKQVQLTDEQVIDKFMNVFYAQTWEYRRDLVGYLRVKPLPAKQKAATEEERVRLLQELPPRNNPNHVLVKWILEECAGDPDPEIASLRENVAGAMLLVNNWFNQAPATVPTTESAIQQQVDAKVKDLTTQITQQMTTIAELTAKLKKAEETKAVIPPPLDPTSTKEYKTCYEAWKKEQALVEQLTKQLQAQKLATDSVTKAQVERLQKENATLTEKLQALGKERDDLSAKLGESETRLSRAVELLKQLKPKPLTVPVVQPVPTQVPSVVVQPVPVTPPPANKVDQLQELVLWTNDS